MTSFVDKLRSGEPLTDGERAAIAEALEAARVQVIIGLPTIHRLVRGEAVELENATLYGASDLQTWGEWTQNDGRFEEALTAARAAALGEAAELVGRTVEFGGDRKHQPEITILQEFADELAAAIRALKDRP